MRICFLSGHGGRPVVVFRDYQIENNRASAFFVSLESCALSARNLCFCERVFFGEIVSGLHEVSPLEVSYCKEFVVSCVAYCDATRNIFTTDSFPLSWFLTIRYLNDGCIIIIPDPMSGTRRMPVLPKELPTTEFVPHSLDRFLKPLNESSYSCDSETFQRSSPRHSIEKK